MQDRVFFSLNLDKKYHKLFFRAKQMPIKGLIGSRCNAFEAVPEGHAIHKLNAHLTIQNIKNKCKYR